MDLSPEASSLLTLIGTAFSIIGAAVSIWQAKKSKKFAAVAEKARDQIVGKRQLTEVAHLLGVCSKAQKSMEKYGSAADLNNLKGSVPSRDASDVQEFLQAFRHNREYFEPEEPGYVDSFCDEVESLLSKFVSTKEPNTQKKHGTLINRHLANAFATIKRILDARRDAL